MKFKVKFNESKVVHTVRADKKEDFVKYITENASKIDTIEKLTESVKVTPELVDRAWKELQRRARKNHYISTQAMEAVCHDFSQYSEWDDDSGTDMLAFDQIWDLLIDRMDAANYELVDADDYNKMFNLPTAPQTSLDVQMNTMRRKNNAMVRESEELLSEDQLLDAKPEDGDKFNNLMYSVNELIEQFESEARIAKTEESKQAFEFCAKCVKDVLNVFKK